MIAYRYDIDTKIYDGTQMCQLDPLESEKAKKDIYLLPAYCTFVEPLEPKDGFNVVFNGTNWEYQEIPVQEEEKPEEHIPTKEEKIAQLDAQYVIDKNQLMQYYLEFSIVNDTEGMESVKEELENLAKQYDLDLAELEKEE